MSEQKHERMARIEGIDLDTGQFSMILATEGEASDGDILSIKGGNIPAQMPMLTSHWNDPSAQLGSITDPVKLLEDKPPRLRATGHIEMTGEGVSAEIRRDLAHMIDKGHVSGMSIRWDEVPGKPPVRRVNLPSDHPFFVDAENEKDHRKRWGLYFEQWKAMEGSIVALGADPKALIGRADECVEERPEVSRYWRAMAGDAASGVTSPSMSLHIKGPDPADESPEAKIAASLAGLRIDAADCHEAGASHADMINAIVDGSDEDFQAVEFDGGLIFLPAPVADQLRARLEPEVVEDLEAPKPDQATEQREPGQDPATEEGADQRPPLEFHIEEITTIGDLQFVAEHIKTELAASRARGRARGKELLDHALGRVK